MNSSIDLKYEDKQSIYLEGFCFRDSLNYDFQNLILSLEGNSSYNFNVKAIKRNDLNKHFKIDYANYSGFKVCIDKTLLKKGKYLISFYINNNSKFYSYKTLNQIEVN